MGSDLGGLIWSALSKSVVLGRMGREVCNLADSLNHSVIPQR
jgi:hypothetical protein